MKLNPWIGVILVTLAIVSTILFHHFNISALDITSGIFGVGIAILMGYQHSQTQTAYKELRESIRPPPSLVDEEEKKH